MNELQDLSDKGGARRRLNHSQDDTVFLVFGILREDKRIDLAIEAVKGLPFCRLVIAGERYHYDAAAEPPFFIGANSRERCLRIGWMPR